MMLESVPISALAEVRSGGGAPQDLSDFTATGHPFVRAGSLPKLLGGANEASLEKLETATAQEHGLSLFPTGTVLFAKSGMSATKGHVYRLRRPAYVVNHLAALIPHDPNDSAFLVRVLQQFPPAVLIKDPAYPSIRLGDIENMRVLAPPDSAGRMHIAEVLDWAEALRAKRRTALAQLDTLTQSIFRDSFGDHTTILGRWPTRRLGDLLDFLTSGSRGWAEHYAESGDLFFRIQNVGRDELLLDDIAYVTPPDTAEAKRTRVEPGDVLLSITADLGRTAVVPEGLGPAFINQHLSILRTKALVPRFLSAYLTSPVGQRQVSGRNRHGVKAGVNFDDIRSFIVPAPPTELQQDFVHCVAAVEKLKASHRASLAELGELFAALQHRAFRAEL